MWIWIAVGFVLVILAVNWVIVMGTDPRKWKGGGKDEQR